MCSTRKLAGPVAQRVLQLSHQVLALDANAVLRRHAVALRSPLEQTVPRLAFIAFRKLASRLLGASGEGEEANTTFLGLVESEWVAHLGGWGISRQEWQEWEAAYKRSDAWHWLLAAETDYLEQVAKAPEEKQALRGTGIVIALPPPSGAAAEAQAEQGGSDNGSAGSDTLASSGSAAGSLASSSDGAASTGDASSPRGSTTLITVTSSGLELAPAGSRLQYKVAGLRVCCRGEACALAARLCVGAAYLQSPRSATLLPL